jgi:hypothetical protein
MRLVTSEVLVDGQLFVYEHMAEEACLPVISNRGTLHLCSKQLVQIEVDPEECGLMV